MSTQTVVLDSGVFAKMFLREEGREHLLALLKHIDASAMDVICPDIFVYEVLSIAAQNDYPIKKALGLIRLFEESYLQITPPNDQHLELAMRMAEDGHQKSGFPSIYDSMYHALAIAHEGMFITADKRHVAKTKQYQHVCLLEGWSQAL